MRTCAHRSRVEAGELKGIMLNRAPKCAADVSIKRRAQCGLKMQRSLRLAVAVRAPFLAVQLSYDVMDLWDNQHCTASGYSAGDLAIVTFRHPPRFLRRG